MDKCSLFILASGLFGVMPSDKRKLRSNSLMSALRSLHLPSHSATFNQWLYIVGSSRCPHTVPERSVASLIQSAPPGPSTLNLPALRLFGSLPTSCFLQLTNLLPPQRFLIHKALRHLRSQTPFFLWLSFSFYG